jgi:hypothetical protein
MTILASPEMMGMRVKQEKEHLEIPRKVKETIRWLRLTGLQVFGQV